MGVSGGYEWAISFEDGNGPYGGVFAPIGIEVSLGVRRGPFSQVLGLVGSFVDFGTLVSYRFSEASGMRKDEVEDTVDDLPEVKLQHVFSPALSLVLGVTENHPLSVGVTAQLAPRLRTLKEAEEQLSVGRLSLFCAIDLTLLRF